MNKDVNQGGHRQLLQPQQWTGYENPQFDESLLQSSPPPYASIPSAPPVSNPNYYDQVSGDIQSSQLLQHSPPPQYQPQQYQPQLYQPPQYQPPNVHSSPVAVNTTVNVNVGGMVTPSPYGLAGCCGMGNENSAIAITIVILVCSFFSFMGFLIFVYTGFSGTFTPELWLQMVFILPSAILFPASLIALNGIFKENPAGLFFMLTALAFYFWLNFIVACILFCVIFVLFLSLFAVVFAPQFLILLIAELFFILAYLSIEKKVKKVLTDFHIVMLRRNMINRH